MREVLTVRLTLCNVYDFGRYELLVPLVLGKVILDPLNFHRLLLFINNCLCWSVVVLVDQLVFVHYFVCRGLNCSWKLLIIILNFVLFVIIEYILAVIVWAEKILWIYSCWIFGWLMMVLICDSCRPVLFIYGLMVKIQRQVLSGHPFLLVMNYIWIVNIGLTCRPQRGIRPRLWTRYNWLWICIFHSDLRRFK